MLSLLPVLATLLTATSALALPSTLGPARPDANMKFGRATDADHSSGYQVTNLITHEPKGNSTANNEYRVGFDVLDPDTSTKAHCDYSWANKADYNVPTYTLCSNTSFQFQIEAGSLKDLRDFSLGITFSVDVEPPYVETFFSRGNVTQADLKCKKKKAGTDCTQKEGAVIKTGLYAVIE